MSDQEKIAALARGYWENEGKPEGRAAEHWARAEQEYRQSVDAEQLPHKDKPEDGPVKPA